MSTTAGLLVLPSFYKSVALLSFLGPIWSTLYKGSGPPPLSCWSRQQEITGCLTIIQLISFPHSNVECVVFFNDATLIRAFPECEDLPFLIVLATDHSSLSFVSGTLWSISTSLDFAAVICKISFLYVSSFQLVTFLIFRVVFFMMLLSIFNCWNYHFK